MVKDTGGRLYPSNGPAKWVTRDIAALDFLLGIPMGAQEDIVREGWAKNPESAQGKWWEPMVARTQPSSQQQQQQQGNLARQSSTDYLLEQPTSSMLVVGATAARAKTTSIHSSTTNLIGGGRRLDGDAATKLKIPASSTSKWTRQRTVARQAQIREWELEVAQDVQSGRIYFSAKDNYPVGVFSVIKYEPKREQAERRRKKLEARGGGGTQFVVPERDWRGTSYRVLLPRKQRNNRIFNRFLRPTTGDSTDDDNNSIGSDSSSSTTESNEYVPGFLDDPEMVQGRHRHVMIGDRVTGGIVSSTIQFVKPADLKADLNKQFRERFDQWEPPKSQHQFIGAKIIDGVYTLCDPAEEDPEKDTRIRPRTNSVSNTSEAKEIIRMPPSLTLSKIRSIKQQALQAAVKAQLEISTVALAFVYFERLCLDCRVDKSNRRLSFAACMLLAAKINESNVALVMQSKDTDEKKGLKSLIRPTKESNSIFASLLEFFTEEWSLSLKHLFSAEWGVFAALGFKLNATPSQVAFHFRRLMKVLGWSSYFYLGVEMYSQWQESLLSEESRRQDRETRKEIRRKQNERRLFKLELQQREQEHQHHQRADNVHDGELEEPSSGKSAEPAIRKGLKLLNRWTSLSSHGSNTKTIPPSASFHQQNTRRPRRVGINKAISLPQFDHVAININDTGHESGNSSDEVIPTDDEGIMV